MRTTLALLILLLFVLAAGAAGAADLRRDNLSLAGGDRSFHWYAPPGEAPAPGRPLVLVFHGGQGSGAKIAEQTGFDNLAREEGFVVAFPDSLRYWNDGRAETGDGPDDVAFVRRLVAHLVERAGVDPKRVYATGISNGGMFTLRLACEASDLIAAAAPVTASFPVQFRPRCEPARPVPILMINGTADGFIQWHGGEIRKGRGRGAGGTVIPVPETQAFWRRANGCTGEPEARQLPDRDPDDGTRVTRLSSTACRDGSAVTLLRIEGGGHTWPGGQRELPGLLARLVGPMSRDIEASREIWDFVSAYRLP